ncbi:hypothetical protein BC332_08943 [Capsicum chinense]|uniref:Uncharacterized protein n=1 Tax=Capsicum annuum TaxID=4072 RepID=A0A2G3A1R0_CAPAN|nr:hypothetical protein T459_10237 [Capsicum annuum]PHU23836.1 hypothetical protein BC332_08943 [Capsicum chinense]
MESSKWLAAVASIWVQCSSGASYAFGIYSPVIKSSQSYDQSTLDVVSVFKDIGANAGILSGLLYTAVASKPSSGGGGRFKFLHGGPWVVHLAGAVQCFAGYFFMWLAVTGIVSRPPVAVMSLFMFIAAHAQTFLNTANVVAAVQNFPDHSGTIVGIMKGFLGLSGAILIQVYQTIFNNNPSSLILMLALLPTIVTLMLMFLVTVHETPSRNEENLLNGFLLISLAIAAYLLFLRILENLFVFPEWAKIITFLILLALLASPISVVIKAQRVDLERLPPSITSSTSLLVDEPASPNKSAVEINTMDYDDVPTETVQRKASSILQPDEQKNLWQAMCTIDFWFLFFAMICGMGSGLATINNISQIGESLGYSTLARSTLVSFWSIWNFLGRLGAGYVSDIFLLRRGLPRPLFMVFTLAAMTAGHVIIASGFPGNLYVGSLLVGICYGSQWSLMPTITKEIFGVLHMGTIFNTIAIASPVGSYILSVRVIGYIYDKEASGEGNSCFGTHCFMLSYFILASGSLFGVVVALALFYRTRRFYSRVLLLC